MHTTTKKLGISLKEIHNIKCVQLQKWCLFLSSVKKLAHVKN